MLNNVVLILCLVFYILQPWSDAIESSNENMHLISVDIPCSALSTYKDSITTFARCISQFGITHAEQLPFWSYVKLRMTAF